MHICSTSEADAAFSPQSLDFRSVSCRKQRWFLKWQIQNTTACSSFCSHEKQNPVFSGLHSFSHSIFGLERTAFQREELSCSTCCHRHLLSAPAVIFFTFFNFFKASANPLLQTGKIKVKLTNSSALLFNSSLILKLGCLSLK